MSKNFLSLSENATISSIEFGAEKQPLLKVDSYQEDPSKLIDYASAKRSFIASGNFYPGVRMPVPNDYLKALIRNLGPELEATFGVNATSVKSGVSVYSIITKPADKLDFVQTIPHFDGLGDNKLAMIHYLCDKPNAGTSFYHHKALGFDYVDQNRHSEYKDCLNQQFENNLPSGYIQNDSPEFKKITTYDCVFNRLLIYKISSLHCTQIPPEYNYDSNPKTGRLTITSFVEFN